MGGERQWCVYLITNTANGKQYVGKTGHAAKRWYEHVRSALKGRGGCPLLNKAIRKHGPGTLTFIVLSRHATEAEALREEASQIAALGTTNSERGYNLSTGGQSGVLSKEARDRISQSLRGHPVSEEARIKIRAARALQAPTTAHLHTPEAVAIARAANATIRGLTDAAVVAIRVRYATREASGAQLAAEHGVSRTMVSRIVRGRAHAKAGGPIVSERFDNREPLSAEHKAKLAAGSRATAHTPAANEKRRQAMAGRSMSEEFKQKIRTSWIGRRARSSAERG